MSSTNNDKKYISLGVHGTRDLYDDRIRLKLLEIIKEHNINKIVTHAEPHGVCEIARKLAQEEGLVLELHFLDIKKGRGMFSHRSLGVIQNSDYTAVFHDGVSKGTSNEVKLLKKLNKDFEYYVFERDNDWSVDLSYDDEDLKL